mgnify:CR=1 FL=1
MKKYILILGLVSLVLSATPLPDPDTEGGMGLNEANMKRMSKRDFKNLDVTKEELSQLLWAAYGMGNDKHRTVPSSKGKYPFTFYVFLMDGVYKYLADTHEIELVVSGDYRAETGQQDFVKKAGANICFVGDYSKEDYPDVETKQHKMNLDAGYCSQNMYLVCADKDLKCVIRGMVEQAKVLKVLGLTDDKYYVPLCFSAGK